LSFIVIYKEQHNLDGMKEPDNNGCLVCKDLLRQLDCFFSMLQSARKAIQSEWLTVDDIAAELKISKSIVYKLIRNGELDAVNLAPNAGKILQKGHYRIQRESLNNYLHAKRVFPLPRKFISRRQSRCLPQVKNYLGL
jgi:excisionase family DNA binding protein